MIKKISPLFLSCIFAVVFVMAHLVAAVLLHKERLFMDATYYFFHVVNESAFRIEHQRVILALSQSLLLAGVKLHLPVTVLLVLYSITPVLYAAGLIFICLYCFKDEAGAWLIMLCGVCGTYFLYYCPMYEVCYAVTTFGFLWVLTRHQFYKSPLQALIYLLVLATALFGYPLIAWGVLILPVYYLLYNKRLSLRLVAMYVLVFIAWGLMKYFFISDYEKGKVSVPTSEYPAILRGMLSVGFLKNAMVFLFNHYKEPLLAAAAFIVIAIKNRNYLLAMWQVFAMGCFVLIINLGYRGDALIFSNNFERMYLLLVPVGFAPFLLMYYPALSARIKILCVVLLFGVAGYKSVNIWQHSSFYAYRLKVLDNIAASYTKDGCTKAAVNWQQLPKVLDQWSTGMDLLIYSSARGKGKIISDSSAVRQMHAAWPADNRHFIIRLDEVMEARDLNPLYFNLDSSAYCFVAPQH